MTVRDVDVENAFDDFDDGWFGRAAPVGEAPTHHAPVDEPLTDDTDSWYVPAADSGSNDYLEEVHRVPADDVHPPDPSPEFDLVPTRRDGFVAAPRPASWESRISHSGAWEFKTQPASRPWYRSPFAALAVVVTLGALAGSALLLRAPDAAVDESTTVAPSASSAPAPTSSATGPPSLAPAPPPPGLPPPPLPPPPPAAEEVSPPAVDRQYSPSYRTPEDPKKPQLNVTRAPMSATPPPPPKPDRNSSTPGDGRKRGGFHF